MKKLVLTLLVVAALIPARAQLFSPESFSGAAFGAMMGSIIGGDCHGPSGQGAAIGAGVGFLAGALAGEANRRNNYYSEPASYYVPAPSVNVGYVYSGGGSSAYVYYSPNHYTAPGYYYRPVTYQTYQQSAARPNYAVNTTLLGAASGAMIGSANHNAGKGAAIGAASGLVLGGIAEHQARKQERRVAEQTITQGQQQEPATTQVASAQPQTVRSEITSRPVATSTYTWTQRPQHQEHQIADAPRVPDAPTF
jgi:outer membrane lipoprotein SlyB